VEPDEILKRAWEAVQSSGVPESMQDTAFKEAVAILRGEGGVSEPGGAAGQSGAQQTKRISTGGKKAGQKSQKRKLDPAAAQSPVDVPTEAAFFSELANESGVPETDLRDILNFAPDGTINVTPPTRRLGGSKAEQARTVVAVVAPARRFALQENPVSAEALRRECQRKNCLDTDNFAATVISRLEGVNYGGSRAEIVVTSKWVDEFTAAVNQAHGRTGDTEQ
jgi:hypothetical protein